MEGERTRGGTPGSVPAPEGDDPESVELPERPRAREDLVFRELADEWVLFDPRARRLHVMNLTAALVWNHCDGERTVEAIVRAIRGAFPHPPTKARAAADVNRALEAFVRKGLLAGLETGTRSDGPGEEALR